MKRENKLFIAEITFGLLGLFSIIIICLTIAMILIVGHIGFIQIIICLVLLFTYVLSKMMCEKLKVKREN